ncbi:hypothetical protein A3A70_01625 [candidate division WWE3 bacterium RIFCSPLOWO2_01_FULL_42_11]|uniref:Uncharacterized protein n=1 Tax=candidate division WWE3 bacterium RIFCSPLOWO2_01_FULL_42_11 TaxID=1802627 RepID=A0A1F4VS74_UNCKA|nr:MAG: hypothetical protein A3A70_01625 [candidate division WWE3 bacterium RIFCSPLOWO2_01_FULL_42_11]
MGFGIRDENVRDSEYRNLREGPIILNGDGEAVLAVNGSATKTELELPFVIDPRVLPKGNVD